MIPAYAETYLRLSRQCMGSAFDYATHEQKVLDHAPS